MKDRPFSLAESYQRGELDGHLDTVLPLAASEGIVLLPDHHYAAACCDRYELADLLLPLNEIHDVKDIVDQLHDKCLPDESKLPELWFSFADGYYQFEQAELAQAFIRSRKLTKKQGNLYMDGERIYRPAIKQALYRTLAIVRADPGRCLAGTVDAVDALLNDEAPAPDRTPRDRLTLAVVGDTVQEMGIVLRHNLISGEYETTGTTPAGRRMGIEDLVTLLHDRLADTHSGCTFDVIERYTAMTAREHPFNPVLDLLAATKWDGTDRLPQVFQILGIEDDHLSQMLVLKWLWQAVALLLNDEAQPYGADGVLVLNGEQGTGKTSFFRHLALRDEWLREGCSIDDRDKDTTRRVVTRWISELGEIESTLKSDVSKLKAFITAPTDAYRLPYGHADVKALRRTSLCATCNSDRYLIDTTGNRRFWSVPLLRRIPREELDQLDALQLWAQVYADVSELPRDGRASIYRLTEAEQAELADRNGELEKPSKGQDEVADILAKAERDHLPTRLMTVTEWKDQWSDELHQYAANQISMALKRLRDRNEKRKSWQAYGRTTVSVRITHRQATRLPFLVGGDGWRWVAVQKNGIATCCNHCAIRVSDKWVAQWRNFDPT